MSNDIIIFSVVAAILAFFISSRNKGWGITLIFSIYIGSILYSVIPFLGKLIVATAPFQKALNEYAILAGLSGIVFFLIKNNISSEFSFSTIKKIGEATLLSLGALSLVLFISQTKISLDPIYKFSSETQALLSYDYANLILLVFPLLVSYLVTKYY
jgi:hypothetical protein